MATEHYQANYVDEKKNKIMLAVLSPAKTLDFKTEPVTSHYTHPTLLDESEKLVKKLKKLKPGKLASLMNISTSLANQNFERYQLWHRPFTPDNARQAILAFNGDVYNGLKAPTLPVETLLLSQKKLRILSGLYGVLKPLDLMQPYRLEMGTKIGAGRSKDLYAFWKNKIAPEIREALDESGSNILLNLASNEYFKSIDLGKLRTEIISPSFREMRNGEYKVITLFAKKARGLMTRFVLENNIDRAEDLQAFDYEGYMINPRLSESGKPVFTRG